MKRRDGTGCIREDGYVVVQTNGVGKLQHVMVAECALGRPLPAKAVVHHVDENPSNNAPTNLVICRDQAYHNLLHQRMRALAACGNADWLKCEKCKQYDDPKNLRVWRDKKGHTKCYTKYRRELRERARA